MEREVKLRELELREKELAHGNVQPYSTPNLKSKLPKFNPLAMLYNAKYKYTKINK
jgi:hypothetical protein